MRRLTFFAIAAVAAAAGCGGSSGISLAPSPGGSPSPAASGSAAPSATPTSGLLAPSSVTLSVSGNAAPQTGSITVTQNGTTTYPTLTGSTCFSTPTPKPSSDPTTPWTNFSETFTTAGNGQASYTVSGFKAQNPGSCSFSFAGQFGATATVPVSVTP